MAEGEGFEPSERVTARRFSRPLQSTTLPPLRVMEQIYPTTCDLFVMREGDGVIRASDDERFMRLALREARLAAQEGEVPVGAGGVYDATRDPASSLYIDSERSRMEREDTPAPRVISSAHNRRELDEDPAAHAEFLAMELASCELGHWRLSGCTDYVTLEPCLMCAGLMVNARVDGCVYGASDPKGGAVGSLFDVSADERLDHNFPVRAGVLEEECSHLLKDFFRDRRRGHRRHASA